MSMTFKTELPPRDVDVRYVVVHYNVQNKPHTTMSVKDASELGLLTFTTDDRGYVETVTSLEGEPGFPGDVKVVRPIGNGAGGKHWLVG